MLPFIEAQRSAIAELCRRSMYAACDCSARRRGTDFDPGRSDVDLLVSYLPGHSRDFGEYLALRDALSDILGRPVDLVMEGAVENPFIRAGIERSRQALYGA